MSTDACEENIDAGYIWTSMLICKKVAQFQSFCWGEHPQCLKKESFKENGTNSSFLEECIKEK
jgi:hypothetical protein